MYQSKAEERCYGVVVDAPLYYKVEGALLASEQIHCYMVTTHDEVCHPLHIHGPHHHIILWCRSSLSELTLGRHLRRYGQRNVDYRYEMTRNIFSLLMYITQPPREILHNRLDPYWEHQRQTIQHDQREGMQLYIDQRDAAFGSTHEAEKPAPVPQEIVPIAPSMGKKTKIYPEDAFRAVVSYKVCDYDQLLSALMMKEPDLYWSYASPHNRKHLETITNDAIRVYYKQWSWAKQAKDRAEHFTEEKGYLSIQETREWIRTIADVNGFTLLDVQRMVVPWLLGEHPKKNCFYIYGPSNTCKTKFARSLADGVYNLGMYLTSNEFYFQECKNTSLILWEETKITDERQLVSDCKKIFEGSPIKCNKKHQDGFWLKRTPVLCTSNYTPWEFVKDEKVTFENRMTYLTFYEDERLVPLVKHLNPLFWVEVLEKGREYDPEASPMEDFLSNLVKELTSEPAINELLDTIYEEEH